MLGDTFAHPQVLGTRLPQALIIYCHFQVLSASDADADEEGSVFPSQKAGTSAFVRRSIEIIVSNC